eukprot:5180983-Amphidinium_carterae.2
MVTSKVAIRSSNKLRTAVLAAGTEQKDPKCYANMICKFSNSDDGCKKGATCEAKNVPKESACSNGGSKYHDARKCPRSPPATKKRKKKKKDRPSRQHDGPHDQDHDRPHDHMTSCQATRAKEGTSSGSRAVNLSQNEQEVPLLNLNVDSSWTLACFIHQIWSGNASTSPCT